MQDQIIFNKIQYRNASYQGGIMNSQRSSFGIIISDRSEILLGIWQHNKINGFYAYISENQQAYGEMRQSQLYSFNVIVYQDLTIYAYFKQGLIHGHALFKFPHKIELLRYEKGIRKQMLDQQEYSKERFNNIIKKQFKDAHLSLRSYISSKINNEEFPKNVHFRQLLINGQYRYYGFNDKKGQGNGLGMVFKGDSIFNCGWYNNTELNGIGRTFSNDEIQDGVFAEGLLKGIGIKYNKNQNKYTYGIHSEDQQIDKGIGFPTKQIIQIRKQFHLRSVHFENQVIVMPKLININRDSIINRQPEGPFSFSRITKNSKNPQAFNKSKDDAILKEESPLRTRLKTYAKQSELDESGQKLEPMELYQPINRLRNNTTKSRKTYFQQDVAGKKKFSDDVQPTRSVKTRFYDREQYQNHQEEDYQKKSYVQQSDHFKNSQEDSLIYKDTMQMIKALEREEKKKRDDLAKLQKEQESKPRNKRSTYT